MIRAECHTDDMRDTARFDATPFFESASDAEILALADCGWGGDYPADEVAMRVSDLPGYAAVDNVFGRGGFECHVHEPDALGWLRDNRPGLHAQVCLRGDISPSAPFGDEFAPHWDTDPSWGGEYAVPASPAPSAP